ncbi:MAG TPA: S8 family serine peptidase [Candidatus Limnocylindrales bacterium]|nr:S8 family serine peptidase [Candidatus Limnocylindrales bacterium]
MRRKVATLVAVALLLLTVAGPAAGGVRRSPSGASGQTSATASDAADPSGRWIVLYKNGTDARLATAQRSVKVGFRADRTFTRGLRGFSAKLSDEQVERLRHDAAVAAIIPDERVEVAAQVYPTGIDRIGGRLSETARIDGVDQRVDADVAVLDTGIAKIAELNVVGGHDCSTSNPARWRDVYGHGTHVAGTIGAIDNGSGVVGVAPGVRLWAVKVIDDSGNGLLSWYACGIDWVYAQRDPKDPRRPLIEAVNMSITKWGRDDGNCGASNGDILHASICRLVRDGVTVVVAAANDSGDAALRVPGSYDEVITVSALADSDGKPGGLGGNRCFSWGTYDSDDTFADFSNYGKDVDLIAPGKCIYSTLPGGYGYSSGTSMASPHVTGAAALVKAARPYFTPAEVKEALQYLGTLDWKTASDPDSTHEKLLNVSKLGPRGDFAVSVSGTPTVSTQGGSITYPLTVTRDPTTFERIVLRTGHVPRGVRATFDKKSLFGFEGLSATVKVRVSEGLPPGTYELEIIGDEHGHKHKAVATFEVTGPAIPPPPTTSAPPKGVIGDAPPGPRYVTTGSIGVVSIRDAAVPDPDARGATPGAAPGTAGVPTAGQPAPLAVPATTATQPAGLETAREVVVAGARPIEAARRSASPFRTTGRYAFYIAC